MNNPPTQKIDFAQIKNWNKDAKRLVATGDLKGAHERCIRILELVPMHADAYFLLGLIAATAKNHLKSEQLFRRAVAIDKGNPDYHAHLARVLSLTHQTELALNSVEDALLLGPENPATLDTLGVTCSIAQQHEKATNLYREALKRKPDAAHTQFNLAASLKYLGDLDGAEEAYQCTIDSDPKHYRAHWGLSTLRNQTDNNNHITQLTEALEKVDGDIRGELQLRHSLAKEYEDIGNYDESFRHLTEGNAKYRKNKPYSIETDRALMKRLREHFTKAFIDEVQRGYKSEEPIFIFGMPRTGTTLVERILTSHSKVFSAGELISMPMATKAAEQKPESDMYDLGKHYLEDTRPATGELPHFIDKMPINFMYAAFIHLALPNAKMICLRRNPMDACLSNFRQLFAENFRFYNYSNNLIDTGNYYILFDQLMAHWHEVMPGAILEVQYESVVANQEEESRRIVEHCGLDWEDACLNFEKNKAPVATASSTQVREPIYTRAVERWRKYEKHLQPLRELLESNGIEVE